MGLDVYLHHLKNAKKALLNAKTFREESQGVEWDSEEYKALAAKYGLDDEGQIQSESIEIEIDSKSFPEHMFKVGYFRSAYNDSGLNSVLEDRIGMSLYDIFNPNNEYQFVPDWNNAKNKIEEAINLFSENLADSGNFTVIEAPANMFSSPSTSINNPAAALEKFMEHWKRHESRPKTDKDNSWFRDNYSNIDGTFYLDDPYTVYGVMYGFRGTGFNKEQPVIYLIVSAETREGNQFKWYQDALEIVKETIDYVLAQKDPQNYYLYWSG